jgi:hypothetical protein
MRCRSSCRSNRNGSVPRSHPEPSDDVGQVPYEGTIGHEFMTNSPFPMPLDPLEF